MSSMGTNIKKLREQMGMSQDQLAKRIGKTRSAISQYESGKIVPRMGVIEDLASVLRVDKTELIGDKKDGALSHDEIELLALFNSMDYERRMLLLSTARAFANEC